MTQVLRLEQFAVRGDERESLFRRIGLAAAKYWVCKRATPHAAEAMECFGGNGYAEIEPAPGRYVKEKA